MEITRQADYYGLDAPERAPVPPAEHLADVLKAPTPWQGPMKVAKEEESWEQKAYKDFQNMAPGKSLTSHMSMEEVAAYQKAYSKAYAEDEAAFGTNKTGEHLPGMADPVRPVPPLTTQGSPTPAVQPETERVNQSTEIPAGGGRV